MKTRKRYPATGVSVWRVWVDRNGVHHTVLNRTNYCVTCMSRDHKGKKEIRNASTT